jgi:Asp/Glu/hydantoin racemase
VVDVPVVGAGSAGAALALAAGGRVGVLGITPDVPQAVTDVLGPALVADRVPDGVASTLDLLRPETRRRALDAAEEMREAGAEAILFACTGLTTIGLAQDVTERTGLPVVDAVLAAGTVAAFLTSSPHQPTI